MSSRSAILATFLAALFLPVVSAGEEGGSGDPSSRCVNLTLDGTHAGLIVAYTLSDAIGVALGSGFNSAGLYAQAVIYPSLCAPSDPLNPISQASHALPPGLSPSAPLTP